MTQEALTTTVTYRCWECHSEFQVVVSEHTWIKCEHCGYHIWQKVRPPTVKKVSTR